LQISVGILEELAAPAYGTGRSRRGGRGRGGRGGACRFAHISIREGEGGGRK